MAPYREGSSTPKFDAPLIQLFLFSFGPDQPEVREAFDLPDANQLLLFGPVERRTEPLARSRPVCSGEPSAGVPA